MICVPVLLESWCGFILCRIFQAHESGYGYTTLLRGVCSENGTPLQQVVQSVYDAEQRP
jgi:hypothetical protein